MIELQMQLEPLELWQFPCKMSRLGSSWQRPADIKPIFPFHSLSRSFIHSFMPFWF